MSSLKFGRTAQTPGSSPSRFSRVALPPRAGHHGQTPRPLATTQQQQSYRALYVQVAAKAAAHGRASSATSRDSQGTPSGAPEWLASFSSMSVSASSDIHSLAQNGQAQLVASALASSDDVLKALKARDPDDRTVLHAAVLGGAAVIDSCLHALSGAAPQGEDASLQARKEVVDATDSVGSTALCSAATIGNLEMVKALVDAGANVAMGNNRGLTPLHYAASKGHVRVGELLIAAGADINARDRANQLPLHRACSTGSAPFVRLILASESPGRPSKPRLNLQDRAGNTPMHLAIESGHAEVAVILIEGGADRDRTDSDGRRPEEIDGVGGVEGRRVRDYIVSRCGRLDE